MNPIKRIYTPVKTQTILIVDDDQVVVDIYREKFLGQGFKVEVADNAARVMQRLKKDRIDLVILDLCLPGMNGLEVLRNIRSEFDVAALPIIVFSNAHLSGLGPSALEAGATKCVTKADSLPHQTLELVRELLTPGYSNAAPATSELVVSNARGTCAAQYETEFHEKPAAALPIGAPETLAKLRTAHLGFAKTEQEDLRRGELCAMHRHVRSLTGSAGLLGFRKIAQMANAFEALLIELQAKPKKITPSVIRTVAQAIDTLASLFNHAANPPDEVLVLPRVLVLDDEIISREMICSALGKVNLTVVSLDDSIAAQRLLEQDHFDLIFLDVEMPGQSGLELCVKIREMATNTATPVVFVTSHSDFASRAQSTCSGGNDFIAKPFLSVELAVKALTWLFKERLQPLLTTDPIGPVNKNIDRLQPFEANAG
jgi:CheY-like chemotaxis protein